MNSRSLNNREEHLPSRCWGLAIGLFLIAIIFSGLVIWPEFEHNVVNAEYNYVVHNEAIRHQEASFSVLSVVTDTGLFDGNVAYSFALEQCEMGPRPTGSDQGWLLGDYIMERLGNYGWSVSEQMFAYQGITARNIVGHKGNGPIIIIGAHYDTRPIADRDPEKPYEPIIGANDGASGVGVLLELARVLDMPQLDSQVWLTFFDAEDRGHIDGWPYAVGSEYMAKNLEQKPEAMILVDMIGDLNQDIYWESNSDPQLLQDIWEVADQLGYGQYFLPQVRWGLADDHIAFINQGIPSVDIIDFDYPYWHTTRDTCDKIGPSSLERVGRVIQEWLYRQPTFSTRTPSTELE